MEYVALFEPDAEAGGVVISFPDLAHGVSQAENDAEATEMATDLLSCMIGELIRRGEPLPKPKRYRGNKYRVIQLPALHAAKAELYRSFVKSGLRKADFARRAGISKTNVDRLFDLNYGTGIDQLESAFRALGKRIDFQVSDAA